MTVSSEMSFSLSRPRSTLRSMSIAASSKVRFAGKLLIRRLAVGELFKFRLGHRPELHLDGAGPQVTVGEPVRGAVDVHRDAIGVGREHPALHDSLRARLDPDKPPGRPPPVPRLGQRAVHARRGNLKGVRDVAHHVGRVERGRHLAADQGRVVEADTVVAVDHHAQQPPPTGDGRPDRFQVHSGGGHYRPDQAGQAPVVHRAGDGAGATGHHDLLVSEPSATLALIFAGPAYRPRQLHAAMDTERRRTRRSGSRHHYMACLEPMLRRRQLLAASTTTLPLFLALSACAGPDPLAGPPPLSADVRALLAAVAAEQQLTFLYKRTMAVYSALAPALGTLLAEHQAHLAQLRARIIEPPGKTVPAAAPPRQPIAGTPAAALTRLRTAEQAAITAQLRRLAGASPSLAQLYASIAASEATHVTELDSRLHG